MTLEYREGDGGVGGVDLLEAGLNDVVAQPHDQRVRLVRLERRPVLLRITRAP